MQVLFTSNPSAPGGPVLRSAPGQAVFTGQQLRQTLEKPDVFLNEVAFKTLGLFPGTALQEGRWRALDGNRYVVSTTDMAFNRTPLLIPCILSSLSFLWTYCAPTGAATAWTWVLTITGHILFGQKSVAILRRIQQFRSRTLDCGNCDVKRLLAWGRLIWIRQR